MSQVRGPLARLIVVKPLDEPANPASGMYQRHRLRAQIPEDPIGVQSPMDPGKAKFAAYGNHHGAASIGAREIPI